MKYPQIRAVHDHSLEELRALLADELGVAVISMVLEPTLLGGWTNINLRMKILASSYTLKLPGRVDFGPSHSPFQYEYDIQKRVAEAGLSPKPYTIGRLSDRKETPFVVYEYAEGLILSDIREFEETHRELLSGALTRLRTLQPQKSHLFTKTSDYIEAIGKGISSSPTPDLNSLIERSLKCKELLFEQCTDAKPWSGVLMHGDLQTSNVLLQEDSAIFLDLESCARGNSFFDLAYLLVQSPESRPLNDIRGLYSKSDGIHIEHLIPVALYAVICWTLSRLLCIERGVMEENLVPLHNRQAMTNYISTKLIELEHVLHQV